MNLVNVIASVSDMEDSPDKSRLLPIRLFIPSFLPVNAFTVKSMVNDLSEELYCDNAWIVGDDASWASEDIHRIFKSMMDWQKIEVLEYDWDAKDQWGDKANDPYLLWQNLSNTKHRAKDLEPFLLTVEKRCEIYAKGLAPDQWGDWTPEELSRSPCWMFYYAKNVCRGRLPDVLDTTMTMLSFQNPEDKWIKRYFGTKRYRVRNRKALSSISWAA